MVCMRATRRRFRLTYPRCRSSDTGPGYQASPASGRFESAASSIKSWTWTFASLAPATLAQASSKSARSRKTGVRPFASLSPEQVKHGADLPLHGHLDGELRPRGPELALRRLQPIPLT